MHAQRLPRGRVRGDAYRAVGPLRIAPVALRQRPQRRSFVVDQLAPEIGSDVATARVDWRRRADVRLGRHSEVVGRFRDPYSRRPGKRPVRADPHEHRDLRSQLAEDDLVLGFEQTPWSVEDDRRRVVVVLCRLAQLVAEVVLGDGIDVRVEVDGEDARCRCGGWRGERHERSEE